MIMQNIYVTGHRNPDMDSVCSAWAYAALKQKTDKENSYIPIRCGGLNPQTKSVFDHLKIKAPVLMDDIRATVADIALRDIISLESDDPVYRAIEELDKKLLSMIPVFSPDHQFSGIISIHEISTYLINENLETRPRYHFITKNIPKVLPGYFYSRGKLAAFDAPLMIGAMPYEISIERITRLQNDLPLLIVGLREDLIEYAISHKFPGIILTGVNGNTKLRSELSSYDGIVYVSEVDTAETIRLLRLSAPISGIMNKKPKRVSADTGFEEAKKLLLASGQRGLPVFDGENFSGIVSRRCFIEKPKPCLILVDHNELEQSVQGADEAVILEVIDHHRPGLPKTGEPIHVDIRPLGSTCTIIYHKFLESGIEPNPEEALIMLSGILSDTLLLESPTTSALDKKAVEELSTLSGRDWQSWGREIFSYTPTLKNSDPAAVVLSDFKSYEQNGVRVGIGQFEVNSFDEVREVKQELLDRMSGEGMRKGLDWVLLLITNILKQDSILLATEPHNFKVRLPFTQSADQEYDLPGILSRKKQLLPAVLKALEKKEKI